MDAALSFVCYMYSPRFIAADLTTETDTNIIVFGPFVKGTRLVEFYFYYGFIGAEGTPVVRVEAYLMPTKPSNETDARNAVASLFNPQASTGKYLDLPTSTGNLMGSFCFPVEHTCGTEDVYLVLVVTSSGSQCNALATLRRIMPDDQ